MKAKELEIGQVFRLADRRKPELLMYISPAAFVVLSEEGRGRTGDLDGTTEVVQAFGSFMEEDEDGLRVGELLYTYWVYGPSDEDGHPPDSGLLRIAPGTDKAIDKAIVEALKERLQNPAGGPAKKYKVRVLPRENCSGYFGHVELAGDFPGDITIKA